MKVYGISISNMEDFLKNPPVGPGEEVTVTKLVRTAKCNVCGREYEDQGSVEMTEKWIKEGYAPCPIITCPGEMEINTREETISNKRG